MCGAGWNEWSRELYDKMLDPELLKRMREESERAERTNWQEWIGEWNHEELTVAQEFEWLRANPKWSTAQAQRVKHLEEHLDAGDVLCKCYRDGE